MSIIIKSGSSSNLANVDTNGSLQVNMPTTSTQAGYQQNVYNTPTPTTSGSIIAKPVRVTSDGEQYTSLSRQLFLQDFNTTSTQFNGQWGITATTMTAVAGSGFMRLNNSAITTTTTGVSMYSQRVFNIAKFGTELRIKFVAKHTNATATNKQAELGLGYYAFAAGQAAQMNEFIGFRWSTTGGLIGVLGYSTGGAPTELTLSINSNVPFSDSVFREYELIITDTEVEYWVNGTYYGRLTSGADNYSLIKSNGYPLIMRMFNSGAASAAMTLDIGSVQVQEYGAHEEIPQATRAALMGRSSVYTQPELVTTTVQTQVFTASGTAPTGVTVTNATPFFPTTALGGLYRLNGATLTTTVHTNYIIVAYQNPVVPTAAGAALNNRNFIITSIQLSPLIVSGTLTTQTGGVAVNWFAAVGASTVTTATTDANGSTTVAAKAPRFLSLSTTDEFAATPAAGTTSTRKGDSTVVFQTPLVVHPGEVLHVGFRSILAPTVAATAGSYDGSIYVNGYWD
jgi:hypothetical protein